MAYLASLQSRQGTDRRDKIQIRPLALAWARADQAPSLRVQKRTHRTTRPQGC